MTGRTIKDCIFHDPAQDLARYCDPGVTNCERHQEFQELWNRWAAAYTCPGVRCQPGSTPFLQNIFAWCRWDPIAEKDVCSECFCSITSLCSSSLPSYPCLLAVCETEASCKPCHSISPRLAFLSIFSSQCCARWPLQARDSARARCDREPEELQLCGLQRLHLHAGQLPRADLPHASTASLCCWALPDVAWHPQQPAFLRFAVYVLFLCNDVMTELCACEQLLPVVHKGFLPSSMHLWLHWLFKLPLCLPVPAQVPA